MALKTRLLWLVIGVAFSVCTSVVTISMLDAKSTFDNGQLPLIFDVIWVWPENNGYVASTDYSFRHPDSNAAVCTLSVPGYQTGIEITGPITAHYGAVSIDWQEATTDLMLERIRGHRIWPPTRDDPIFVAVDDHIRRKGSPDTIEAWDGRLPASRNVGWLRAYWRILGLLLGPILLALVARFALENRVARARHGAGLCVRCGFDLKNAYDDGCPHCQWGRATSRESAQDGLP